MAQAGSLMAGETRRSLEAGLAACVAIGWLDDAAGEALERAARLCWNLLQAAKLLSDRPLDPERIGEGGLQFVLRETGHERMAELRADLDAAAEAAGAAIDAGLGTPQGEE